VVTAADELEVLAHRLGVRARRDRPLGALTTYRVGGPAALTVEAATRDDLLAVRQAMQGLDVPVLVLGRGSNLLVADQGFPGLVVRLAGDFGAISVVPGPGGSRAVVHAGAAASLPTVARQSVEAGLTGLEWAVGVPGSVGGALRMNAGGHGSDVAASLERYEWLDLSAPDEGVDTADRLSLGYRSSALGPTQVVLWAELAARRGDPAVGRRLVADVVRWRREHQPGGTNAGSVFVNPSGDAAGRLVEAAGLKGLRLGSAVVSPKHANFIQADPGGSANDVRRLMEHVRGAILERFGVALRTEVRLIGFPDAGSYPECRAPERSR
jgi:UDP-N-acetylmuramate dehydrogenase